MFKMNRRGQGLSVEWESITNIALWILFIIIAIIAVTLLVRRLTG